MILVKSSIIIIKNRLLYNQLSRIYKKLVLDLVIFVLVTKVNNKNIVLN